MSRRYDKRRGPVFAASGDLILPPNEPEIKFLLRVTAIPKIEQTTVEDKKLSFSGCVDIFLEYVANTQDGTLPLTIVQFTIPAEGAFRHRRALTGMNARLKCKIKLKKIELVNSRKISATVCLKISRVKLVQAERGLPPHVCRPSFVNFFKGTGYSIPLPQKVGSESTNQSGIYPQQFPDSETSCDLSEHNLSSGRAE